MRHLPRSALALLAATALASGAAACTTTDDPQPTSPATGISPASSAQRTEANTVPPGVSGQGSEGGEGQGSSGG